MALLFDFNSTQPNTHTMTTQTERISAPARHENPEQTDQAAPTGGGSGAAPCSAGEPSEARQPEMLGRLNLAECFFIGKNHQCGMIADQGAILMLHIPTEIMWCLTTAGERNLGIGRIGGIDEIVGFGYATEDQVRTLVRLAKASVQQLGKVVLGPDKHTPWK